MKKNPLFYLWAALLFTSCDVKDPIYNTPHPEHGKITLTADWSARGAGIDIPASYTVRAGDYTAVLSGATATLDHLFAPGTYPTYLYSTPEHITVSGTTATVAPAEAGTWGGAGAFVHAAPGWLFTCAMDAVVEKDTDQELTAAMQQQVRQLTLVIEPTGGTVERIAAVEGYLSGVAGTFVLDGGTHGAPSNAALMFTKIAEGADAGKWAVTVRLLGTAAGARQALTAVIRFIDDDPQPVTLTSDLTTTLAAFNTDKRTPLTLGGEVVETPTGAGFTATITDWEQVTGNGPVYAE